MLVWQQPWADESPSAQRDDRDLDARLRTQLAVLTEATDAAEWTRGFGPGAAQVGEQSWQARTDLGVDDVTMTLMSVAGAPDASDGSRSAKVRVAWTSAGSSVSAAVVARVIGSGDGEHVDVTGFDAGADPLPLWLAGRITVDRELGVVTVDDGAVDRLPDLVTHARAQIETVVDGQLRDARVVVPASAAMAASLLGRTLEELGSTAGVATSLAGMPDPVVVLNPEQFEVMDDRGSQIVVTHELTHATTGAVGGHGEVWLVEGFADWVALRSDTVPVVVAAGDLMRLVAADGAPEAFPTAADLASATSSAAYQGAWLAVMVLETQHGGAATVVQVYRDVLAGTDLASALTAVGTTVEELTAQWRDYVTYSASTVS